MEQLCVHEAGPVCPATVSGDDRRGSKAKRRRKYIFSDQIDHLIREIYLSPPKAKTRPGIRLLAKKVGMPHWALKKRARELGLARTKELPWSERELEILARYAWMSDERIRLKLKAAGYARTVTGIHLKLKRMRFKHDGSFYSASGLAQALGIDSHAVTRWEQFKPIMCGVGRVVHQDVRQAQPLLRSVQDLRRAIWMCQVDFQAPNFHA